jgi:hypothetical protein
LLSNIKFSHAQGICSSREDNALRRARKGSTLKA